MGYESCLNPTARIGGNICEGHDFALIQNRYLVDYWAWRVCGLIEEPIFDLEENAERLAAESLYGDPSRWESISLEGVDLPVGGSQITE